jgi:hypothetical protein
MGLHYEVNQGRTPREEFTLLVYSEEQAEEFMTDGAPNDWRTTIDRSIEETETSLIICVKCDKLVELHRTGNRLMLSCDCAECPIVNIEDTLTDVGDEENPLGDD